MAANVLNRRFAPDAPGREWAGDITCTATAEDWPYLTVAIDLFNREVIGWPIKPRMTADLVFEQILHMSYGRVRRKAPFH